MSDDVPTGIGDRQKITVAVVGELCYSTQRIGDVG